jgi:hypothetical protein
MGFYMYQVDNDFCIRKENFDRAMLALKLANFEGRWTDRKAIEAATTLVDLLLEYRWVAKLGESTGDINHISFDGEKYGDDDELWRILARYVEHGSFIEMRGDEDSHWRWVFWDGGMHEVTPSVVWPEYTSRATNEEE